MRHNVAKIYVVSTPIGNREDLSYRAVSILKQVDYIAAEDTRHAGILLSYYGISTKVISLHAHNEAQRALQLISHLEHGGEVALISDAGTPLISDPGQIFLEKAREAGIKIISVPGPCALIAALSISGLSAKRFVFEGFLPKKQSLKETQLREYLQEGRTVIFYESKHRMHETLVSMCSVLGSDRKVVIARELTKKFESINSASLGEMQRWFSAQSEQQKGEFVLLLEGVEQAQTLIDADLEDKLRILLSDLSKKDAVSLASKLFSLSRNTVYKTMLALEKQIK